MIVTMDDVVATGGLFLDEHYPGWFTKVDRDKLNMYDPFDCLLGQLYGTYGKGLKILKVSDPQQYGFALPEGTHCWLYMYMTDYWKLEIEKRMSQ